MVAALEHAAECPELSKGERDLWRGLLCEDGILHTALADLAAHLRGCPRWGGTERWAHELAAGASPLLPPPKPLAEDGDTQQHPAASSKAAVRERLQAAIDERRYRAMVANVANFPSPHSARTIACAILPLCLPTPCSRLSLFFPHSSACHNAAPKQRLRASRCTWPST